MENRLYNFFSELNAKYNVDKNELYTIWNDINDVTNFLNIISKKYNLDKTDLGTLWDNVKIVTDYDVGNEEEEFVMEMDYKQQQATYNENDITLHNFGFQDDKLDVHSFRTLKITEGEERLYLRLLIITYNHLKYAENIKITPVEFHTLNDNLKNITFHTKKSPLGLLLAIYLYDKTKFMDRQKFAKLFNVKENTKIDGNTIVPIGFIFKTYANDLIRYVKLLHKVLD